AGGGIRDRQGRDLLRQAVPAVLRVDRQAVIQPARDDRTRLELGAESGGDGQASLAVHRVPVLAGEHLRATPVMSVRPGPGGERRGSLSWFPTLRHFAPLRCILATDSATSMHK